MARGAEVFYRPNLGALGEAKYKSGDPLVAREHVKALDYAWMDLSIISCKYSTVVGVPKKFQSVRHSPATMTSFSKIMLNLFPRSLLN